MDSENKQSYPVWTVCFIICGLIVLFLMSWTVILVTGYVVSFPSVCDGLETRIYNPILRVIDNQVSWSYNHTSIGIMFKWWPEKYLQMAYEDNIFTLDVKGLYNVAYARYTKRDDAVCLSSWRKLSEQ